MRKVITILFAGAILMSCSKTPEDACNCIKEAANGFMLEGIKISSIDDLREPCKGIIDKFKEDPTGRAKIASCGEDVLRHLADKEPIPIEGKKLVEFPSYKFESMTEFINATKDQEYKYRNTNITIDNVYLGVVMFSDEDNRSEFYTRGYSKEGEFGAFLNFTGDKFDINKFTSSWSTSSFGALFDLELNKYTGLDSYTIEKAAKYPAPDILNYYWRDLLKYRSELKELKKYEYPDLQNDLKNGRFIMLSENDNELILKEFPSDGDELLSMHGQIKGKVVEETKSGYSNIEVEELNSIEYEDFSKYTSKYEPYKVEISDWYFE